MKWIFRAGNGLDVDEPHAGVDGAAVGDVVVADHAYRRRVVQLQVFFHGNPEAAWIGFGRDIGDDGDAFKRLEAVLQGVGVDRHTQVAGKHFCDMVPN